MGRGEGGRGEGGGSINLTKVQGRWRVTAPVRVRVGTTSSHGRDPPDQV